ncbi:Protein CBR-USP-33 [Caenorhabditis briggsae]|uniref:Ubiquitin carboxyl-terminal hydrolase n=1 Tax=Caenorhabditis briggsae TaxID=6238 RepID=A8X475_CAEBR|nr:Protein CBR-USP-33 [Caenorhabditis briggsae]CAP27435.2 Protein CBR-USP-33 [Caenorhabditis briggsae]
MGRKSKVKHNSGPANNKGPPSQPKRPSPQQEAKSIDTKDHNSNKCPPVSPRNAQEEDYGEWCHHMLDSNTSEVLAILNKPRRCIDCPKTSTFTCIHKGCVKEAKANCCDNLKHIFPHIITHNHPAMLHHAFEVVLCTRCDTRTSLEHFLKHHAKRLAAGKMPQKSLPKKKSEVLQKGLLGYINFGNTCYINSVLQLLAHCPPFVHYLISMEPPGGWRVCPPDVPKTVIQFAIDLRKMYSPINAHNFSSPWKIIQCVRNELPGFETFQQQDASEFLRNLLDILDRDLKACAEYYDCNDCIAFGNPMDDYEIALQNRTTRTVITACFQGVLENQIRCHSCGFRSVTTENFLDLSIPILSEDEFDDIYIIPKKSPKHQRPVIDDLNDGQDPGYVVNEEAAHKISLDGCLGMFFQNSILSGDNKYSCSNCKTFVDATKTTRARQLPNVILIQLKRFRHTGYGSCKIGKTVEFPIRCQDFGPWTTSKKSAIYDLIGFVVHDGRNMEFGHYVAFCKHEFDNQWCVVLFVTRIDASEAAKNQPYILMYRKRMSDEEKLMEPGESPFNFFQSARLFNDKNSEAWELISKSLNENYKIPEKVGGHQDEKEILKDKKPRKQQKKRIFTKEQTAEILAKTDVEPEDLMQHIEDLEQILRDLTLLRDFSIKQKLEKRETSQSESLKSQKGKSKSKKSGKKKRSFKPVGTDEPNVIIEVLPLPEEEINGYEIQDQSDLKVNVSNSNATNSLQPTDTAITHSTKKEAESKLDDVIIVKKKAENEPDARVPADSTGEVKSEPISNNNKTEKAKSAKSGTTSNASKTPKLSMIATSDESVPSMSQFQKPQTRKPRPQTSRQIIENQDQRELKEEINAVVESIEKWFEVLMEKEWLKHQAIASPEPSPAKSIPKNDKN